MTQVTQETVETQGTPDASVHTTERAVVVVRLGEITLKKKNRPYFVRQLARNIRQAARGLELRDVEPGPNRILITAGSAVDWPELRARVRGVFRGRKLF